MENETGKEIIFEVKYRIKSKSFRNDDQQVMLIGILCLGSGVEWAIIRPKLNLFSILNPSYFLTLGAFYIMRDYQRHIFH